jgi:asparagine synthetase B (glutamine-hydrolysing)
MCGIGCFIGKRTFSEDEMKDTLRVMNDTQHHRGPDSSGCYIDRTVGLCHTRLSIIDLSEKAGQPFISEDVISRIMFTHKTTPGHTPRPVQVGDDTRTHCMAHHN